MRGIDTLNEEMLRLYIYAYSADDVCYPSKRPLKVASRPSTSANYPHRVAKRGNRTKKSSHANPN